MILNVPGILNMAEFWIWQGSQYASVAQCSEYARMYLDRVLNISWILHMSGFWIWQGSEYARVIQRSKYATICLNRTWICLNMSEFSTIGSVLTMYHTINSPRSFYKLLSTYWEIFRTYSEPGQRSKMERFGKIIRFLNYFCKKLHLNYLGGFWICDGF